MKISTRGRYALRLMLDLAIHHTGAPIRIKDVAARQGISDKYLEQIISALNKAGYVKSARGPLGGYQLSKPAGEYTVGMILRLTEGNLSPVACIDEDMHFCERKESCAAWMVWKRVDEAIQGVVNQITLADLVSWQDAAIDKLDE